MGNGVGRGAGNGVGRGAGGLVGKGVGAATGKGGSPGTQTHGAAKPVTIGPQNCSSMNPSRPASSKFSHVVVPKVGISTITSGAEIRMPSPQMLQGGNPGLGGTGSCALTATNEPAKSNDVEYATNGSILLDICNDDKSLIMVLLSPAMNEFLPVSEVDPIC